MYAHSGLIYNKQLLYMGPKKPIYYFMALVGVMYVGVAEWYLDHMTYFVI